MADTQSTTEPGPSAVAPLSGLAMKRRGPVAVWLGLPIITLGIYQLVWYYKIHKELNEYDRRQNLSPAGSLLVLLFLSWTLIAPLVSFHNTGKAIADAQRAAGLPVTCSPAASTWLAFAFGLNVWYIQRELNRVVEAHPGATPGTQVPLAA
ncbi:DUF4234 domain-containing protein [Streptomyces sp. CL7]|uniref:DUF4234 domain-containing protein n=1 Tax=Streptomyces sp. CL7 TaxID=3096006 RepID=UPI002A761A6F|nr:DUF4234 domain-containing protein [Streptomyces sp. CL7]WPP30629.1 DUF4234 domain-containing protein [Streptomyces sp. CL7]